MRIQRYIPSTLIEAGVKKSNLGELVYNNLEKEHICCAISNNKDVQVSSKKAWLSERFDEGLVFLKSVERGKCFIEYIFLFSCKEFL